MITAEKLDIYQRFNGDIQRCGEFSTAKERSTISDDDWCAIEELIQNINLVETGLASKDFVRFVDAQLNEVCDNEQTVLFMKSIA
jgi:hypothetical protein